MSKYKLRPHHGLCTAFFEGKGYSSKFVENMAAVIQTFEETSYIQLTIGEDIICTCCPNNKAHKCVHSDKVMRYDKAVLTACNLFAGQVLNWGNFRDLVRAQIIQADKLCAVCGDCEWNMICQGKAGSTTGKRELP